jgi:SAM-dependent methyltransferase
VDDREAKRLVRDGYDRVSHAYRADDFGLEGTGYARWLEMLSPRLFDGARILDLGCGCGVPVAKALAERHRVTGVDISPVQIERARRLVPGATFLCEDMTSLALEAASFDAVVALYAIIHVPLAEQADLFARIARWLAPGGWLIATVGHTAWTGTEKDWRGVSGATMYWSHADAATYRGWLAAAQLELVQEADQIDSHGGQHTIVLARSGAGSKGLPT